MTTGATRGALERLHNHQAAGGRGTIALLLESDEQLVVEFFSDENRRDPGLLLELATGLISSLRKMLAQGPCPEDHSTTAASLELVQALLERLMAGPTS